MVTSDDNSANSEHTLESVSEPLSSLLEYGPPRPEDFPDETWDELREECREIDRALAAGKLAAERYIVD